MSVEASVGRRTPGALQRHGRVLLAIMLRDVRTRMGSAPAFIIVVLWPLSHILALVAMYSFGHRLPPFGNSIAVWAATGVTTFMCFSYTSRFSMLGILQNRPLLGFPIVQPIHLMMARIIIQIISSAVVIIIVYIIFFVMDIEALPADPIGAAEGMIVVVGIGVGFGLFWGVAAGIWPSIGTFYILFQVIMWITSGIFFVPSQLPKNIIAYLKYHPILQGVEWVRSAYFINYDTTVLNKPYAVSWAITTIFAGLAADRLWRGRVLRN